MKDGRHEEAEILIAHMLAERPGDVDALILKAAIAMKQGAVEPAYFLLAELASQVPDRADVIGNLGAAHAALGRTEEALACLEQAVLLAPEDARRRSELGRMLLIRGEFVRAREEIVRMQQLALLAGDTELLAEGWSAAAALLMLEGEPAQAEKALRTALDLRPGHGDDLAMLATLLVHAGRTEEALPFAEQAYLASPANHERALSLASCLADLGRPAEAERLIRRVIAIAPAYVPAQAALARSLIRRGDTAGGLAVFAPVVRHLADDPDMLLEMARLLRLAGDLDKALVFADSALKLAPDKPEAHQMRTRLLMGMGRFDEVWPAPKERMTPEAWGHTPLFVPEGLAAEEVLLLARFARQLVPSGRLACHAEAALGPLLEGVAGLAPTESAAPEQACPLTALPELLGVSPEDMAAEGYLAVEKTRYDRWGELFSGLARPLIGIVWDGDPSGLSLDALKAALAEPGTLVSLVFDQRRAHLQGEQEIVDAGAHFTDARDLVAAVARLDLVCGADGLALHVAGALAQPAIVIIPPTQPWTWAHRNGRSLWYPSAQVVRQEQVSDWDPALEALGQAVREKFSVAGLI
ncbi:tetratricopeptide repeat protein [Aquabacter sp. CN5-332]|uniref:tetratricopeptide repeat protein n=1 Tax=Aquabacter sp. CN5-332 TaxID=3156608 RepID=UPI0032B46C56